MHLAYVSTGRLPVPPVKGGAVQTHIDGILPYIAQFHHVTVFSAQAPELKLPAIEQSQGVTHIRLPLGPIQQYVRGVCEELAKRRCDLIHVYNRPQWVCLMGKVFKDVPIVMRLHNEMMDERKISAKKGIACIERVSAIDTVSDFISEGVARRFPAAAPKLRTIYTGVDEERFYPHWTRKGAALRRRMRNALGLTDEPVVLFVGRLSPTKGPHVLIRAMKQVIKEFPRAVLLVVGSPWFADERPTEYTKQLEQERKELGDRMRFTGYIPALEIERAFAVGDVFVCPSQWKEPLARVHFEAMASGLPIVTTARGGNPEVVWDGVNGYVVQNFRSPEEFARRINHLLANPRLRRAMGERGRRLIESRFTFLQTAAQVLDLYDSIFAQRGRAGGNGVPTARSGSLTGWALQGVGRRLAALRGI